MNILHFSNAPLAGAPLRLTAVLQHHTSHDVRLVDARRYGTGTEGGWYGHDIVFSDTSDAVVELAERADIIHLHDALDLDSTDFAPLNFRRLADQGTLFLRHFHSPPHLVASHMGVELARVLQDPLPSLVMAHHAERFYPNARVVPSVLPHNHPDYLPLEPDLDGEPDVDLIYSPSSMAGAWESRWGTKGAPETVAVMDRVSELTGCSQLLMHNQPLAEVLTRKRCARIVIDDLVGGSYHLSGLEGICMGKPVLTYMDNRADFVLREISGSTESPFINIRLEDAVEVLTYLVERPEETAALGEATRTWMETHWRDDLLAGHYTHVYNRLTQDPTRLIRQHALQVDSPGTRFKARILPDLLYESRRNRLGGR